MQSVKKEVKPFYEGFLDSQLFEQFTQNILTSDCDYFNKKVESFGKKDKNKEKMSIASINFGLERNYIVKPDFLKLDDDSNAFIERTMTEKFKINLKTNENGIILPSERNITNLNDISTEGGLQSPIFEKNQRAKNFPYDDYGRFPQKKDTFKYSCEKRRFK